VTQGAARTPGQKEDKKESNCPRRQTASLVERERGKGESQRATRRKKRKQKNPLAEKVEGGGRPRSKLQSFAPHQSHRVPKIATSGDKGKKKERVP